MYKIGVIGDRESILGFKAVGLDVFPIDDPEEAKKTLKRIAKEDFAIIYITEQLYQYMMDEVDELTSVKKSVERAVGADILFGGDN